MEKKLIIWVVVIIAALFVFSGINVIPAKDENVNAKWSQVENQYQRRMDLIPNLVKTVKGYATHERSTLVELTAARASATKVTLSVDNLNDPEAIAKFEKAQARVSSALSRLLAVSENYPDLKANQNFMALQSQLEGTENRIAVARKDYIDAVQDYNTTIRTFPGRIWAGLYGAQTKVNFKATTPGADKAPEVEF